MDVEVAGGLLQGFKEHLVIVVDQESALAAQAAVHDVVEGVGVLDS